MPGADPEWEPLRALRARVQALPPPGAPRATYRLQFHAGFGFRDACRLVPYLRDLGVSHVYASPYLRARSGSTHGYDVADPNALNPELGTETEYAELVAELARHGLGQLVDVVPNHMGIGDPGNFRWLDVLENGPSSIYAPFFDINWSPLKAEVQDRNRLVVPTLGDQYGKVLENGELAVGYYEGAFAIHYYEHRFPVAPDAYPLLLRACYDRLEEELGRKQEHVLELASILTALRHLPPRHAARGEPGAIEERNREKEIIKRRIRALHAAAARFRAALARTLREFNGQPGRPASFDRLDALLGEQSYRLAFWRVAAEEINYRRFFDIAELAAVRMEDPGVFDETHRLLLRLVREGAIAGLRIDHPDGLRDPARYFWWLQRSCFVQSALGRLRPRPAERAALEARLGELFDRERARDRRSPLLTAFYVVVEKILEPGERLRADWPVHGTTGYDFLNLVAGLFVARHNERSLGAIYGRFLRTAPPRFRDLASSAKKMVMLISLASEVNELGYLLKQIAAADRRHRDFTLNGLTFVIREVIAALDVYRTYIDPESGAMGEADRAAIRQAIAEAKRRNPRTDPSSFDFVADTLLLRDEAQGGRRLQFVARFQQTTGPVMAKGVEDTAFYVYNRLVSLNEVGGSPERFGTSLTAFHRANRARARAWQGTLLTTSTHDTKRSEDVRARISVLSELPREWRAALWRWSRLNVRKKVVVDGRPAPDRNEEYLLYQALLGAWPLRPPGPRPGDAGVDAGFRQRIADFMLKALKEAKVNTSWINPNASYEAAVRQFVHALLDTSAPNPFLEDFLPLCERVAHFGIFNSLSQTLLKLAAPGVPDVYQGNEIWDFSLVDPDNRRPVDYELRRRLLASLRSADGDGLAGELLRTKEDGRIKLHLTSRLLGLRRAHPRLFAAGSYTPLRAEGPKKRHVCAFARAADGQQLLVVAPVLIATLSGGAAVAPVGEEVWRDCWLYVPGEPGQPYRNLLTGATLAVAAHRGRPALPLAAICGGFPVAALWAPL